MWQFMHIVLHHPRYPHCLLCQVIRGRTATWLREDGWKYYIIAAWLLMEVGLVSTVVRR